MKTNIRTWQTKKLGEVSIIVGGYAFKSGELTKSKKDDSFLPVIKIGNLGTDGSIHLENAQFFKFNDNLQPFLINDRDILIAMTGATVGKVAVSNTNNLFLNQRVGLIRPKNEVLLKDYLKYLLLNKNFYTYCQKKAGGGAQGNISPTQILLYDVKVPSLNIQRQIVEKLNAIKGLQELNQKGIEKTKELFNSILDNRLKSSTSCKNIRLGEIFNRISKTILPASLKDKDVNYIGLDNIESNTGRLVNFGKTNPQNIKSTKSIFSKGDTLYGKLRPYLNKVLLADFDGISSTDIWVLQAKPDEILSELLPFILRLPKVVQYVSKNMSGTNLPRTNSSSFDKITILLPSINRQKEILEEVLIIKDLQNTYVLESQKFAEIFESTLNKVMKGELIS